MNRNTLIALALLAVVAAGAYAWSRADDAGAPRGTSVIAAVKQTPDEASPEKQSAALPDRKPAPPVEVAKARSAQSVRQLQSVGTLASDEAVAIATEVAGRIAAIDFQEGQEVRAGDLLVKLDDALARAELADAEAALRLAESNFERANSLSKTGAGTTRARDEAVAALETAKAAVELAKVRLDKTEIRAPFDGTVGLRQVSVGAYTQIGQVLVNLEKIDRLKLDFRLPEINLRDVEVGQAVEIAVDAIGGRSFEGEVYAIDPLVDVNGRALKVRARLANPDNVLRPGLFARVTLLGRSAGQVVMVPEGAIMPRGSDSFVFTVENGAAVETRVKLGRRSKGEVEILEGLQPEATVVVAGQARLENGRPVDIVVPYQPG